MRSPGRPIIVFPAKDLVVAMEAGDLDYDYFAPHHSDHLVRVLVHREVVEPGLGQLLRSHLQLRWPGGETGKSC